MGVVVVGTGVARPTKSLLSHGARRLADAAARLCLTSAGYEPDSINMLVNVGVYRERGLGEPALAALIQQDVDANAGRITRGDHGTFSFDIDNGACGALTGLDVVRGFLASHAIHVGMVVGSDSGPGPLHARALPRPESGAAILLGRDEAVAGLSAVRQRTYPEYAELLSGYWEWSGDARRFPRRAGNRLIVLERTGFVGRAVECAAEVVADYLDEKGVIAEAVDLLVATPGQEFADGIADRLGIARDRTLHVGEQLGAMHTAQPLAAIDQARRTGRWAEARTILLVSAGSGITVTTALYRH